MRTVKKANLLRLHFGENDRYNGKPNTRALRGRPWPALRSNQHLETTGESQIIRICQLN